jgi:hypothetical protein
MLFAKHYDDDKFNVYIGGAYSTHGREENTHKFKTGEPRRNKLKELDLHCRIILKRMVKKYGERECVGFSGLRMVRNGWLLLPNISAPLYVCNVSGLSIISSSESILLLRKFVIYATIMAWALPGLSPKRWGITHFSYWGSQKSSFTCELSRISLSDRPRALWSKTYFLNMHLL